MTRKKRKKKKQHESRHHVIPSSRGGKTTDDNIAIVDKFKHAKYHELFENRTPQEIVEYLVEYFWKSNWNFVEEVLKRR